LIAASVCGLCGAVAHAARFMPRLSSVLRSFQIPAGWDRLKNKAQACCHKHVATAHRPSPGQNHSLTAIMNSSRMSHAVFADPTHAVSAGRSTLPFWPWAVEGGGVLANWILDNGGNIPGIWRRPRPCPAWPSEPASTIYYVELFSGSLRQHKQASPRSWRSCLFRGEVGRSDLLLNIDGSGAGPSRAAW